tara:strand:+ start:207 stop:728 length:522 start_codon:yes stop_codon:yes gene_type:complete
MVDELARVGRLSLTNATVEDAKSIKDHLRYHDIRECLIHGLTPSEALNDPFFILGSRNFSIKLEDKVIGICGTVPIDPKTARVWMLGTDEIMEHWFSFLKGSRKVVEILQGEYQLVENFVPVDHTHTIMWLQWCGFDFDDNLYDVANHTMIRFTRCKKSKNNVYYLTKRPVMH